MTKNGRRALFLLVATIANMLLTIVLIAALLLAWAAIANLLGIASVAPVAWFVAFFAAIVLAGLAYAKVLKRIQRDPKLCERFGLVK
jgi:O-antigen/teichoic acid export membrane protein